MLPDKLNKSIIPFDWNCLQLSDKSKCSSCKAEWFWHIRWQWSEDLHIERQQIYNLLHKYDKERKEWLLKLKELVA